MKRRNPLNPHRQTTANQNRTEERISQYYGVVDLLATWEKEPDEVQIANHDYIIKLRARVRQVRNLLLHRADASIKI